MLSLRSESSVDENAILELTDDQKLMVGNFVLVQFSTKSTIVYFVGKIEEVLEAAEGFKIKYMRKKFNKNMFYYPADVEDISEVNRSDIIAVLPDPILEN